ncbi:MULTISPECIES: hypothetical protein [Giesbergeria]|uniref:Uncharacterized protein n=1 Tax=Giesbergeria sinuosa TaxID=80883 RepID=A0ABV9QKM7_9BURK
MPQPSRLERHTAPEGDKELLIKGITCALIGLLVLLAPFIARSASVQEMMAQAVAVGWFALVLGCAFIVQYGLRRARTNTKNQQPPAP